MLLPTQLKGKTCGWCQSLQGTHPPPGCYVDASPNGSNILNIHKISNLEYNKNAAKENICEPFSSTGEPSIMWILP